MRRPHRGRPTEAKTEEGSGFYRALGDKRPYRGFELEFQRGGLGTARPTLVSISGPGGDEEPED